MKPYALRRFSDHNAPRPGGLIPLDVDHFAATGATTRYRARVSDVLPGVPVLKSGHNNRKIGKVVLKGRWKGMPIYTLTLEERATCPDSCAHWLSCFGNQMQWPLRWRHGPELEQRLGEELRALAVRHPKGYVVRLHVLGDFYSKEYVTKWLHWLNVIPELRVYGYTHHNPLGEIGSLIDAMSNLMWDVFAVRFSDREQPERAAATINRLVRGVQPEGIVCPEQSKDSDCCATCGLCWGTRKNIAFIRH